MCPIFLRDSGVVAPVLTVDNVSSFVPYLIEPKYMVFCEKVLLLDMIGRLVVFKMRK